MEMPIDLLQHDREPMPAWLVNYQPGAADLSASVSLFLGSRIVLYPGSGIVDGELLETFAASHATHCVLHVDLMNSPSLVADALSRRFHPGIHIAGYRVVELKVWDADEARACLRLNLGHPYDQDPSLRGACWAVLEREAGLSDAHGPGRLAFLHVQCEAVWLFWNLWVRARRPAPHGILLQDHGYGGNWTTFGTGGALHGMAVQSGRLPRWLLAADPHAWPGFGPVGGPTPCRELRVPPELGMGETVLVGGRRLHARADGWMAGIATQAVALGASDALDAPVTTSLASAHAPRRLYFAYGSNMDPEQFRERCPGSEFVGLAVLNDHDWGITGRGVATVRPHPGGRVFGVLARLRARDEACLDAYEGVRGGFYRREILRVEVMGGGHVAALVYVANHDGVGSPRPGYLERGLVGARHHGLPGAAVAGMEAWGAPRLPVGPGR